MGNIATILSLYEVTTHFHFYHCSLFYNSRLYTTSYNIGQLVLLSIKLEPVTTGFSTEKQARMGIFSSINSIT